MATVKEPEKFEFQAEVSRVMDIIINSLYRFFSLLGVFSVCFAESTNFVQEVPGKFHEKHFRMCEGHEPNHFRFVLTSPC
jgi:hypothetical protein